MVVLDTSFLIAHERGIPGADALFERYRREGVVARVPASVWIELLTALAPAPRSRATTELDRSVIFEPLTREIADLAARIQHELGRDGRPLGWHDLQAAATALHYNEGLVTSDAAFGRVPGLEIIGW